MTTKSNGHGKGKKLVSCTVPVPVYHQLQSLAEASGLTPSGYARKAIIRTIQSKIRFEEIEHGTHSVPVITGNPIAEIPVPIDYRQVFRNAQNALRAAEEAAAYQTPKKVKK